MGKVMAIIKAKAAGRADMAAVGARIKARLSAAATSAGLDYGRMTGRIPQTLHR